MLLFYLLAFIFFSSEIRQSQQDSGAWGYFDENGIKHRMSLRVRENRCINVCNVAAVSNLVHVYQKSVPDRNDYYVWDPIPTFKFTYQYEGPQTWEGVCQSGTKQSPIDISTDNTVRGDLGSLKFIRYDSAFFGTLTNTGHSVQILLSGIPVHLTGGGLTSIFILEQLHFHWSAEHTIDGIRDAVELHLVHYDEKYENISTALHHENGICVVAVLFKLTDVGYDYLTDILEATKSVSQWVGKSSIKLTEKVVPMMLLPKDRTSYYRYSGSLTTPGCQETVTWFVFTEKLSISEAQVNILKNVRINNGILQHNFRPTQTLHGRKIYHHLLGYTSDASQFYVINFIYTFITTILIRYSLDLTR